MPLFTSQQQKTRTFFIIAGVIIGLTIIIIAFFGVKNIFSILLFLLEALAFLSILFGIAYLFYFLFIKTHKYDVTYVNKKKLIEAGRKSQLEHLKGLYLSGDKGHTRVHIGKIIGYCRIQVLSKIYKYERVLDEITKRPRMKVITMTNEKGEQVPEFDIDKEEQDVLIVKSKGFLSMFTDPMVIRVSPQEHDELLGDVTLRGFSLIPISEYWFLNTDYLDVRKIDYAILKEAERGVYFAGLSDMKEIVDKAVGLDARHKKGIEEKHLVEIPELQRMPR